MGREVLRTERLTLRQFTLDDAAFMLGLMNEPSYHQFIGDRGLRTVQDSAIFLENGPLASYRERGFGMLRVEQRNSCVSIGMCGLIKRDGIDDVEVGFAFLPSAWSKGYATEAAGAVLAQGHTELGLRRIVAITAPDNVGSIRVLEKIGLRYERTVRLPGDTIDLRFYASDLA